MKLFLVNYSGRWYQFVESSDTISIQAFINVCTQANSYFQINPVLFPSTEESLTDTYKEFVKINS